MTKNQLVEHLYKNESLAELMQKAWEVQQKNFNSIIEFYRPTHTLPISVTGAKCALSCAHCNGQYLKSMVPIQNAQDEIIKKGSSSCLVSGGCNLGGKVEFNQHAQLIKQIRKEHRINMHVGFLEDNDINQVVELADVISLDIPVSDRVISEVYGLDLARRDYLEVYKKLKDKVKTVPHVCIGLEDNGVNSELSVLDILAEIEPEILVFIVFTPTPNTKFESKNPPDIENVLAVIVAARLKLPNTKLILGCMRPRGIYRETLDSMAIAAGLNGVVMPSKSAVSKAEEYGFEVIWKEECCSL